MSLQYSNKSQSQLTSPTPAQLPAVALSAGHIVYRVDHKVVPLHWRPIKNFFLLSHDFQKFNFKLTARALPVIPPKFTGVPVTQSEIFLYKILIKKKIIT
jgi:hypothetical protein